MQFKTNKLGTGRGFDLSKYMVYIILGIVLALFAIWLGGTFFSLNNILNICRQTAMVAVMAVGMTFVLATGNIDLSIGSIVAVTSLICAMILKYTDNIPLAIILTLALGLGFGAANGILTVYLKIPSFLVTLGMLNIGKGIAMLISNTQAIPVLNDAFNDAFGYMDIGGVLPILLIWLVIFLIIGHFILRYLPYGRKCLAVGGNPDSARLSGINVKKIVIIAMMMSGFTAAFAAMLYTGRMQTSRYTFGDGVELNVIAAVVLGGTSMNGGKATIIGSIIGSFLLSIINNGLVLGGLTVAQQMIVSGALIIVAVALHSVGTLRRSKS